MRSGSPFAISAEGRGLRLRLWAAALALLLAHALPAPADIVRLKGGGKIEGRVSESPAEIVIETADGSRLTVPRSKVARIERRKTPQELYDQRVRTVTAGDTQGWFDLGLWCRQNGLHLEAVRAFQKVVALVPDHADARAELGYQRVGGAWIRGTWSDLESEHFLIHYDTIPAVAQTASAGLERFHAAFVQAFCPPLTFHTARKVPITLFKRRTEYLEHVQEAFPLIAGRTENLDAIPRAFTERATHRILGYIEPGEDEALLHAVLFHETTHAFVGMVQARPVRTPSWFDEAFADYLACSMVGRTEVRLGQGVAESFLFRGRMFETRAAVAEGRHIPLRDLLGRDDFPFTDDRVGLMYAQSLTLLYYLVTRASADRPQAFREYLVAVTEGKGDLENFERIFGVKADALEPGWTAFVAEFR